MSGWNESTDILQATTKGKKTIEIPIQILVGLFLREQKVLFAQGYYSSDDPWYEYSRGSLTEERPVDTDPCFTIYRKVEFFRRWGPFNLLKKKEASFYPICHLSVSDSPKKPFTMSVYTRSAMPDCERIIDLLRQGMNVEVRATLLVS